MAGGVAALGGLAYYFLSSDPSAKGKINEVEGRAKGLAAEAKGKVSRSIRLGRGEVRLIMIGKGTGK